MAAGSKRGGDMVLGGRHLVGIFFLLVVVLGLVFTLGYLLGRSQYDTQLRAAASGIADKAAAPPPARVANTPRSSSVKDADRSVIPVRGKDYVAPGSTPPNSDWDFYHVAEPPKPVEKLSSFPKPGRQAPAASDRSAAAPAVPAKTAPRSGKALNAPLVPRGAIILQVAALVRESDALTMAQALQQKKFPAFVLSPESDNFYRVQVGPYKDTGAANSARQRLQNQGFKSIVKR
jgi:cell division septation protein DedD